VPQRSVVMIGSSLVVASLALTGCGSRSSDSGTSSDSGSNKVAKIGVIAPLSGDLAALGKGIQNSVDLAIKQANESQGDPGLDPRDLAAEDDEAKPDVGKNAATKLAATRTSSASSAR
jgi:branched-chain amino acid transport system substrate-binding protein